MFVCVHLVVMLSKVQTGKRWFATVFLDFLGNPYSAGYIKSSSILCPFRWLDSGQSRWPCPEGNPVHSMRWRNSRSWKRRRRNKKKPAVNWITNWCAVDCNSSNKKRHIFPYPSTSSWEWKAENSSRFSSRPTTCHGVNFDGRRPWRRGTAPTDLESVFVGWRPPSVAKFLRQSSFFNNKDGAELFRLRIRGRPQFCRRQFRNRLNYIKFSVSRSSPSQRPTYRRSIRWLVEC